MKAYPASAQVPNRKQRKSQRRKIFEENKESMRLAKKARREARKQEKA